LLKQYINPDTLSFARENPPASTWIGITALAVPDFLIELEATAVLD